MILVLLRVETCTEMYGGPHSRLHRTGPRRFRLIPVSVRGTVRALVCLAFDVQIVHLRLDLRCPHQTDVADVALSLA